MKEITNSIDILTSFENEDMLHVLNVIERMRLNKYLPMSEHFIITENWQHLTISDNITPFKVELKRTDKNGEELRHCPDWKPKTFIVNARDLICRGVNLKQDNIKIDFLNNIKFLNTLI